MALATKQIQQYWLEIRDSAQWKIFILLCSSLTDTGTHDLVESRLYKHWSGRSAGDNCYGNLLLQAWTMYIQGTLTSPADLPPPAAVYISL